MLLNARKLTRGGGREELILLAIADVTARHRADATAERLAAIVKYSDDAIVAKDLNGIVSDWNIGAQRLFGFTAEEIVGKSIKTVIPPERHSEEDDILAKIRRGEHIDHFETVRMRKDGSEVWVSLTISPLKNAEGQIMGASKIARDMTERRRADEQRRTLIGELNHRVKNMMATVQAVAAQTLSSAATIDDAREAFSARLIALAKAHDALTRENWEGADIANVVKATVEPYSGGQNRFTIDGPSVRLQPGAALSFSMAVHELCTNAAKYGALSTPDGRVGIGWRLVGQRERQELHLRWTEQGGPPVTESKRKGFGSRLIERGLAMELGGEVTVSYDPSGVVCTIRAPLWLEGEGNDPACREAAQPSES
jgi:PAS domain S-box-containing protein